MSVLALRIRTTTNRSNNKLRPRTWAHGAPDPASGAATRLEQLLSGARSLQILLLVRTRPLVMAGSKVHKSFLNNSIYRDYRGAIELFIAMFRLSSKAQMVIILPFMAVSSNGQKQNGLGCRREFVTINLAMHGRGESVWCFPNVGLA